jgi:glucokinase
MTDQSIIGIDLGASKINFGKVADGKIIEEIYQPTGADRPEKEIIQDMIISIEKLMDKTTVGIGIGVPGLVDEKNGVVLDVLNIPSWKEVPLKSIIENHFNKKVCISNDANCFALGEKIYGIGKNYRNFVGLSLGSGLGAGIIANNQLYSGTLSMAGEFGGISYLNSNYENYCSGKFFTRNYKTSAKALYNDAISGDSAAIHIFDKFGEHLGNLIKTILLTLGPEAIILGGSVSKTFRFFQKSMMDSVYRFPHKRMIKNLVIEVSPQEKIPVLGAAALLVDEIQTLELINRQIN